MEMNGRSWHAEAQRLTILVFPKQMVFNGMLMVHRFMSPIPKISSTGRMNVVWASPTILKNGSEVVHSVNLGWDSAACIFLQQLVCFVSIWMCMQRKHLPDMSCHPNPSNISSIWYGGMRSTGWNRCHFQQPDFEWFLVFTAALLEKSGFEQTRWKWLRYLIDIRIKRYLETHVFTCYSCIQNVIVHFIHFLHYGKAMATQNSILWQKRPTFTQLNMYVMWDHRNMSAATLLRLLERWTSSWICLFVQSLHGWIPEVIWGSTSSTKGTKGNCLNGFVGSCFQEVDK